MAELKALEAVENCRAVASKYLIMVIFFREQQIAFGAGLIFMWLAHSVTFRCRHV